MFRVIMLMGIMFMYGGDAVTLVTFFHDEHDMVALLHTADIDTLIEIEVHGHRRPAKLLDSIMLDIQHTLI